MASAGPSEEPMATSSLCLNIALMKLNSAGVVDAVSNSVKSLKNNTRNQFTVVQSIKTDLNAFCQRITRKKARDIKERENDGF